MEKQSSEQDEPSSSDSRDAGDSEQPRQSVPGVNVKAAAAPQVRGAALPAGIYLRSTQSKGGAAAATPDPLQAPSTTASTTAYCMVPQISQIAVTAGPIHFSIGTLPATPAAASLQDQSDQPESFPSQIAPQTEQGTPSPVTAVSQQGNSPQGTAGPQAIAGRQASTALHANAGPPSVNSVNPVKSGPVQFGQILFGTAGFFKIPGDSEAAAAPAQSSAAMTSNAIGPLSPSATDETSTPVGSTKNDAVSFSNPPAPRPGSVDQTPLNLDLSNASLFAGNLPVANPVPGNTVVSSPATAAPASPKQRLSTFNAASTSQNASASQNSGDLFTLNPTVPPSAGNPEAAAGAAQTAATSAPASAQDSSSSNGGPDYGDLHVEATAAAASGTSIPVAFEARLSPLQVSAPTADPALPQPSQAAEQFASKPSPAWSSAETNAGPAGAATSAAATLKPETLFDTGAAATPAPPAASTSPAAIRSTTAQPAASAAERMQSIIEAPAPPAGSRQSITVKVPGATSDTGIDLRFVERGGDIHLSVRTASPEMAQELRGGLNDLVGRLEHAGIRTEVSNTSSGGSASADSSKDQSEPDRKGYSRNPGDSSSQQQNSRGSNRSRWMEALVNSSNFSKEQK